MRNKRIFTPLYETADSLHMRLAGMYAKATVETNDGKETGGFCQ